MESTATYSENLQRLQRFFIRPDEAGYAFAVAADERLIPEINRQLTEQVRAHGMRLAMISLESEGEASLMTQLSRAAQEADGLLITGVSTFLNQRGKEALLNFNFSREVLRQLNLPLLFWIDAKHLQALSRQAADLYSQRRMSTLFFEKPLDTSNVQNRLETRFTGNFRSIGEYERLQYRLALLEAQYDEVKAHPPTRFLPDYVLPLARVYSELDLHADAMQLVSPHLETLLAQTSPDLLSQTGDILFAARHYEPALQAYTQALEQLPPERTETRSYLLVQLGDLNQEIGRMQEAERCYTEDLELNQTRGDQGSLAISYERLGSLFQAQGKFEQALAFFQKYNQLHEELFQANPYSESLKNGLPISYAKLGDIFQAQGKFEQAMAFFQQYNQLKEELFQANPHSESLKNGLAISYEKLGGIFQAQGKLEQALEFFQQYNQLSEELSQANPHSESLKHGVAISYEKLGGILQAQGKFEEARACFSKEVQLQEELFQANPHSESLKNGLANSYGMLGDLYGKIGQLEQSLEAIKKATHLFEALFQANPNSYRLIHGLAISYAKLGVLFRGMQQPDKARPYLKQARDIWQQLSEQVSIPEPKRHLKQVERDLANL